MTDLAQYIVVPRSRETRGALLEFMDFVSERHREDVSIDGVVGEADNPKRFKMRATEEAVESLKNKFGSSLFIEPDSELKMLR